MTSSALQHTLLRIAANRQRPITIHFLARDETMRRDRPQKAKRPGIAEAQLSTHTVYHLFK
jgi:hypothetical protein